MPLRSSKVSLAIRVSPDRLFWTFLSWTLVIMPPRTTSVFSGDGGQVGDAVGRQGLEHAGVPGQGMARHVEAERLLLVGQLLGVGQLRDVGQRGCRCAMWPLPSAVGLGAWADDSRSSKSPRWPRRRSSCLACPAWSARGRIARSCDSLRSQAIERTGVDQRLDAAGADLLGRDPLEEVVEARERALLLPRLDDRLDRLEARPP